MPFCQIVMLLESKAGFQYIFHLFEFKVRDVRLWMTKYCQVTTDKEGPIKKILKLNGPVLSKHLWPFCCSLTLSKAPWEGWNGQFHIHLNLIVLHLSGFSMWIFIGYWPGNSLKWTKGSDILSKHLQPFVAHQLSEVPGEITNSVPIIRLLCICQVFLC